ncbi:alpha-amylase family protein [Geodermatophilus sp. YIM 151500]|uniref:alpha-amylase family protein n=1 Tax=Geodermatophilus sp. YIM 151500 TaxID=2984531 RepID=UPI0021E3D4FB|nr:alpha-amylase family protein [Geodermatophilus sp. YIM 151500]MCV2488360.1 alpha-amylase family protein [Geodermatophilus sp. YIM 151500]
MVAVTVSTAARRHAARRAWRELRPILAKDAVAALGEGEADAFLTRAELALFDVHEPLAVLYGGRADVDELFERALRTALAAAVERPEPLRRLDRRREIDPGWFQRARVQGYVCYVDRFCGTLAELPAKLDYLAELGTTYLHLMPLLEPREGENDGGYAVADYRAVDPRLGTMRDLEAVAGALHERDMSLCIDLVLNHTAREHAWAQAWLAGDPAHAGFYTAFPDRTMPDAYDATIPEVFPDRAPGSFSWVPEARGGEGGWVWTTFWPYQWDLDYTNPAVTLAMLGEITWLANRGVDIFRMDAAPFMWKRLGTNCQNQPEAHTLLQLLHALTRLAAPGVVFKAEAIVAPDDLVQYLGGHERYRPECELAYHNQLMVLLWSSLATQDARLARAALGRMRTIPPTTSWCTYVRGHDDIGWAVSDIDAHTVGSDGFGHRRFLNDFYCGRFPGSFARGALFQENEVTGDARISGSAASLCGVESALEAGDAEALDAAVRRLVLLYSVAFAWGGIPLVYMGDELALCNDADYLRDPARAPDNRWMHRPLMDWAAAERRTDPRTLEGRVFGWMQRLGNARRSLVTLRGGVESTPLDVGNEFVLAWQRRSPIGGTFVGVANFSPYPQGVDADAVTGFGSYQRVLGSDGDPDVRYGRLVVPGLGFAWYAEP